MVIASKFTEHFDDAELHVLSERNISLDDILKETYKRTSTADSNFSGNSNAASSSFSGFSGPNGSTSTFENGKNSSDIFTSNVAAAFSSTTVNSSKNNDRNKKKPFRRLTIFSKSRR